MKKDIYQTIYFSYFVLALLFMFGLNTQFVYYGAISIATKLLSPPLSLLVIVQCLKRYTPQQLIIVGLLGLLVMTVALNSDNFLFMYLSYVIVIGAKDIPFRTIVKVHFILALCFCLFNMTVSELGMVKKVTLLSSTERENIFGDIAHRNDYGYGWSTDYAIHVFFILLDYWILRRGIFRFWEYVGYVLICVFIIVNCDARMASLNILLILFFSLFLKYKNTRNKDVGKITSMLSVFCIPIFAFLSLWATLSYDPTNLYWFGLDVMLTGRLSVAQNAIQDVGIPWFGQKYEMFGNGNLGIGDTYNFIDCTYIQSLVIWGAILTCVWVCIYCKIGKYARKRKDWVLMLSIVISGIAGLIAPYSCNLRYCILLLACVASHRMNNVSQISVKNEFRRNKG